MAMRRFPAAMTIVSAIVLCGPTGPAKAQSEPDSRVALEELRAAPKPRQQSDLDTVELASAHRERAESVQEKTNGLWQSWLVSICQGCGADQKPAKPLRRDDYPARSVVPGTGSVGDTTEVAKPPAASLPAASPPERRKVHSSLTEDLSPANISSIRRMPN